MEKFLIFLLFATLSASQVIVTPDYSEWMECPTSPPYPPSPVFPPSFNSSRTDAEVCLPHRINNFYCTHTCNRTYLQCNSDENFKGQVFQCPRNKPYCTLSPLGDYCSSRIPTGCEDQLIDYTCTSLGVFPNENNCNSYYFCKLYMCYQLKPVYVDCPDGEVFDPNAPDNSFCVSKPTTSTPVGSQNQDTNCTVVSCKDKSDGHQFAFRNYKRHYGICKEGKVFTYQCPMSYEADISEVPVICRFKCDRNGNFAHLTDRQKYYNCNCTGSTCTFKEKKCPGRFDAATGVCSMVRRLPVEPMELKSPASK